MPNSRLSRKRKRDEYEEVGESEKEHAPKKAKTFDVSDYEDGTINGIIKLKDVCAPDDADWNRDWVSASSTRNFMLKDPLLDWLKYNHLDFAHSNHEYKELVTKTLSGKSDKYNFAPFIMQQGVLFEEKVMDLLRKKFGKKRVITICDGASPRDKEYVIKTIEAMNDGVPIIHSGVLHNPKDRTYGIPDLLVRSDWLNKLVSDSVLNKPDQTVSAKKLRDKNNKAPRYHYRIVDIKFSTLYLRCEGIHLLNSGSIPAYKSQLYIYNEALAKVQGYNCKKAYILGRRWKYTSKNENYAGYSCFEKLGTINYRTVDNAYVGRTRDAIKWLRECRSEKAKDWNIMNYPLERVELYPNMCNSHDYPWHHVKQAIVDRTKEVTSLWMVGCKNREIAHKNKVYAWTDQRCTPKNLGVNGEKTSKILNEILRINQPHSCGDNLILPNIIKHNIFDWKDRRPVEFYVDFETCNDVVSGMSTVPMSDVSNIIFMIGVGYVNPQTNRLVYRHFTVKNLSLDEEEKICRRFSKYVLKMAKLYNTDYPRCIHWAHAERTFWNDAVERHGIKSARWESWEWQWMDLLSVFKEEPIVVKGALGYGLKSIAGAMKDNGMIKTGWDKSSDCVDGQSAMVAAYKAHQEAIMRNLPMYELETVKKIVKYNEVDVRVLREIIEYLRCNHSRYDENGRPIIYDDEELEDEDNELDEMNCDDSIYDESEDDDDGDEDYTPDYDSDEME